MPKRTASTSRRRGDSRPASRARNAKPTPDAAPRGAATLTEGLDPFDRERASSLADEGGTAGAAVEAQPSPSPTVARSAAGKLWLAASFGLAGLAALYLRRSR